MRVVVVVCGTVCAGMVASSQEDMQTSRQFYRRRVVCLDELDAEHSFLAHNPFIFSGYRIHHASWTECFVSLFELHNETWNVWTHLVGTLLFALFLYITLTQPSSSSSFATFSSMPWQLQDGRHTSDFFMGHITNYAKSGSAPLAYDKSTDHDLLFHASQILRQVNQSPARHHIHNNLGNGIHSQGVLSHDGLNLVHHNHVHHRSLSRQELNACPVLSVVPAWALLVFVAGAFLCLCSSTFYHLFYVQSGQLAISLIQIDYAGIICLMGGALYPVVYYGFYCHASSIAQNYLISVTMCSALALVASFHPAFDRFPSVRSSIYVALGVSGLVPIGHLILLVGFQSPDVQQVLPGVSLSIFLNVSGLTIYMSRVPERWWPGQFDIWCSSHQLWHICVVASSLVWYLNASDYHAWREVYGCPV